MNVFKYNFVNDSTIKVHCVLFATRRFISKRKIEKNLPTNQALKHFDDFYKAVFSEKWPSVRLALLSKPRHVAVINNFGEIEKTQEWFKNEGAFDLRTFLEHQKTFTNESNVEYSKLVPKKNLNTVIENRFRDAEEKELTKLHPEGVGFKSKVDVVTEEKNESEGEYMYKPEDARTSLDFDLNRAEIDRTRLILPDDKILEGNLKEFIPATTLRGKEEYIAESDYYKYYQPQMKSVSIEDEHEFDFPEKLKVFSFDRGDISEFPEPKRNCLNVYDYLKLDGAELLAALSLGVQPGDTVLDMCSRSGNIAFCIFQTLRSKCLICTQDSNTRKLFEQYLTNDLDSWLDILYVTPQPANYFQGKYLFDKVLVSVPSTEDKTALFENADNVFHVRSVRDRLQLPEQQARLLIEGLKLVRPGGTVLYTSGTLSPVQTEGVVSQALHLVREETRKEFVVKNLTPALRHTSSFFNYGDYLDLKFGTLVVPFLPVNFGPRYICKIVKKEESE